MSVAVERTTAWTASERRVRFVRRVYHHLFLAVAALVALEVALFRSGLAERIAAALVPVPWLLVLAAFMVVGWLSRRAAYRLSSVSGQYAALGAYVVAQGLILVPLLYRAEAWAPGTIRQAAQWTLLGFAGLSFVALTSKRDFSFLRSLLIWGGWLALILIVSAIAFGIYLGTWFNLAMIGLSGASVLYDTDRLRRRFRDDRYVAAALGLFASVAMMFWYLLRMLSRLSRS